MKSKVRARHENVNGKLKEFNLLGHTYRNKRNRHGLFFRAIAAVLQFEISRGGATYQVDYRVCRADFHG